MTTDTSELIRSLQPQSAADGGIYYELHYDIILLFGLTELKAQICWMDKVCLVVVLNKPGHLHSV